MIFLNLKDLEDKKTVHDTLRVSLASFPRSLMDGGCIEVSPSLHLLQVPVQLIDSLQLSYTDGSYWISHSDTLQNHNNKKIKKIFQKFQSVKSQHWWQVSKIILMLVPSM